MGVLYPAFAQQAQHVKAAALAKGQALLEQALSQPSFAEAAQRYADTCGRYSQACVSGVCRYGAWLPGLQPAVAGGVSMLDHLEAPGHHARQHCAPAHVVVGRLTPWTMSSGPLRPLQHLHVCTSHTGGCQRCRRASASLLLSYSMLLGRLIP